MKTPPADPEFISFIQNVHFIHLKLHEFIQNIHLFKSE